MNETKILNKIKELTEAHIDDYVDNKFFLKKYIIRRTKNFFEKIFFFKKAHRLMPMAKRKILNMAKNKRSFPFSTIWWSEMLNSAKGRMERFWYSPIGGLYLCITIYPNLLKEHQNLYSLAIPVAICDEILSRQLYPEIRWLNDILINGKKICGILSESFFTPTLKEEYILFGIGLNVNINSFPFYLKDEATSISIETGKRYDVFEFGYNILARIAILFSILHHWEALKLENPDQELKNPIITKYKKYSYLKNRKVIYGLDLEKTKGAVFVSRGIDELGSLILLDNKGNKFPVNSGEIRFID